jgi:sulfonate transport system substrate-binding protein
MDTVVSPRQRRRRVVFTPVFLGAAFVLALSGCGSSSSSGAPSKSQPAAATNVPSSVPPGTTLRIGDQVQLQQTVLASGGQDRGIPYSIQWAGFVGGPSMLQAFHAGAIDVGFVANTPLVFAQAAHQDVVAVAAWASQHGGNELIAAPGSGIGSWHDLKGKKVAYQQGTSGEATLLQGLHGAGLTLHDVKSVNLPFTQIAAALQGGSVAAGILAPPLDSGYLTSHPGAKVVDRPQDLGSRVNYLIASKSAINDAGKAAALRDYILRLGRAFDAIKANPDAFVQRFYVEKYHLTAAAGRALLQQLGTSSFVALSDEVVAAQQKVADLYSDAGEIPAKLDASKEFDDRFADVVREAASG